MSFRVLMYGADVSTDITDLKPGRMYHVSNKFTAPRMEGLPKTGKCLKVQKGVFDPTGLGDERETQASFLVGNKEVVYGENQSFTEIKIPTN